MGRDRVAAVKSLLGWGWPEATKGVLIVDVLFLVALIPLHRAGRLGLADLGIRKTPRKLGVGLFLLGLTGTICFNGVWPADLRLGVEGPFQIGLNEVKIGLTVPRFVIELARSRLTPSHFDRAVNSAVMYAPADLSVRAS